MIIQPYSDVSLAINNSNFPSLAHAFVHKNFDFVTKKLSCAVSDLVLDMPGNPVDAGNGWSSANGTIVRATQLTGTLEAPGTRNTLVMVVWPDLLNANATFQFGSTVSYGIGVKANEEYVTVNDGADYHTLAATAPSAANVEAAISVAVDWVNNTSVKRLIETTAGEDAAVVNGSDVNGITEGISQAQLDALSSPLVFPGGTVSGIFVWYFEGALPEDITAATAWMAANHGKIYPGWKGL